MVSGIVGADHHDRDLGPERIQIAAGQPPDDVLGPVAAKSQVDCLAVAIVFFPGRFAVVFPALGDRVADESQVEVAASNSLIDLLVALAPPIFVAARHGDDGSIDVVESPEIFIAFFEDIEHAGVLRVVMNAPQFLRIRDEVEQLPLASPRKIHQLVILRADAVVDGNGVSRSVFVIGVVNRVPPVRGGLGIVAQYRQDAASLNVGGNGRSGYFQKSRGVIDVLDEGFGFDAGVHDAGPADEKGHFQRFLEHPTFVVPTVLAQVEALVGGIDDDGIVR